MDEMVAWLRAQLDEDELWAKAASADRDGKTTVPGGVHWTWAVGDQWEPVGADPLQPYMGGYDGQWSNPVVLRTVEEWSLNWGGPDNKLPLKIAESEELRTADGAHITRHDPARVLREVESKRALLDLLTKTAEWTNGSAGATAGYAAAVVRDVVRLLAQAYGYDEERAPHPEG